MKPLSDRAIGRAEVEACMLRMLHDRVMTAARIGHKQAAEHLERLKEDVAAGRWSVYLPDAHLILGIKDDPAATPKSGTEPSR